MSDEKPPEKITVAMPPVPAWAIELTRTVKDGFAKSEANHELLAGEVRTAKSDIRSLSLRVVDLQEWREEQAARLDKASLKVRSVSENDLSQDSKLADVIAWRARVDEKLDAQTGILQRLDAVAANPMVRKVAYAIGGAILTYLAARGVR